VTATLDPTDSDLRLVLRPYQEEALARIAQAEHRGIRRQLGVAATGLGKTIIFCALASLRGGRTLILAHRDELVAQAVAKVREVWPDVDVGIVKAGSDEVRAHVVVASVQTLARRSRLARLLPDSAGVFPVEPFDLVVVDEAHHTAAESYRRILDGLDAGEDDGPLLLGVTATPDRGDGKGLDDLFDEITWSYDILWGIRSGFLCDVRGVAIRLDDLDLSDVKVRRGDYEQGAAGQAMEDAHAPTMVLKAWAAEARDRQTIVFTPTVALAQACADEFSHAGINAAMVCGATPLDERREILRAYAATEIQVVCNCAVLTEGFDDPRTDCIVVARPTRNRALYTQMIGRGTRRHPDKADLLVLDVVGASDELSLVTIPSLFGVGGDDRLRDGTVAVTDALDDHEAHLKAVGKLKSEEAELFRAMRAEGIAWVPVHLEGARLHRYQRSLGTGLPTVVLGQQAPGEDRYNVGTVLGSTKRYLMVDVPLELAQGIGEDFIRKHHPGGLHIADADAAWRKRPPTPKQRAFARRVKVEDHKQYATAGDLSDAIERALARRTV
jgi:superfamily II DNA or RNA helicase